MKKYLLATMVLVAIVLAACGNSGAGSSGAIKMGRADAAAHGKQSWASVVVAMQGDKIVGVSLDEYQFMNKNNITAGVPNSEHKGEKTMSLNFKDENVVPASKRVNSEFYSKLMAEHGKSTKPIAANFDAIEAFCIGKTIAEVEDVANKSNIKAMDAVSGATLVDTKGYLSAVVAAAKNAK